MKQQPHPEQDMQQAVMDAPIGTMFPASMCAWPLDWNRIVIPVLPGFDSPHCGDDTKGREIIVELDYFRTKDGRDVPYWTKTADSTTGA